MTGLEQGMGQGLGLLMQIRPSPEMVRVSTILAMSAAELNEAIDREVLENPALEIDKLDQPDDWLPVCQSTAPRKDATGVGPPATYRPTLFEELSALVGLAVESSDRRIAEYLIGSLDSRGFLSDSLEAISESLEVEIDRIEKVLRQIQEVSPPGTGARDVRECLLLQLQALAEQGTSCPLVISLIEDHFHLLCKGDIAAAADQLGVSISEAREAVDFIRRRLLPFPALDSLVPDWASEPVQAVIPTVQIERTEEGSFRVRILESERFSLSLSPSYDLYATSQGAGVNGTSVERAHVANCCREAKTFLAHMRQRWQTLRKVSECLVSHQEDFLLHGPRFLKPLTRADVAKEIGVHESTVSRATSKKYVRMPDGSVQPFERFFDSSLPALEALKELLRDEEQVRSDADLATELSARGYAIARRTVAKYRGLLGIPSSYRRSAELARP